MPELPDFEGFKRLLMKNALGKTISRVAGSESVSLGVSLLGNLLRLQGAKLLGARHHGKHLMAHVDGAAG